ncbi:MAG: preprotein translocase subunit SecA, partial [Acidimicrobiia bacterium]
MSVFQKILHIGEGKQLKELEGLVEQVNAFEPAIEALSDDELRAKTPEFRKRLSAGETLDDIQAEAFAVVREVAKRVLGQRHFDVQVVGAGALHLGMIAEMRTGEGKTLVSTMPCYLNALDGGGVHVVTVNDYLAKRDSEWMGDIYRFLGLEVGLIQAHMEPHERKPSYDADITYGTNNEFGFDYLRDNMAMRPEDMVQRGHAFAVVDEVDSILVDEARTPLIISGRVADTAKWYRDFARIADRLQRDLHYEVDEAKRQVLTTEEGVARVEETLGIENMYDYSNVDLVHHLESSLRAKELFERDVEYLVSDGEVKIVDEFTGRVLDGRRYSEGLHQAIEAKEGVAIKDENQTLATITLQNYFRMYEKLSGMTGTALTEEAEFNQIYGLSVVEIPTNAPIARVDEPDLVYMTEKAKFEAVADDLAERHKKGQPVLVGTVSIEKSERLAALLKRRNIPHQVLNAKQHEREAHIIAQAGGVGVVTVATNMAGRGVDIRLGGNPEELALAAMARFPELEAGSDEYQAEHRKQLDRFEAETLAEQEKVLGYGGLYVLATERHDSRRIDNQLRGRSGRQGDPGESRFYLSLEDDLMRRFASDRVSGIMARLKMPEDVPIEHKMVTKAIERAQTQVEAQNFEIRKNVLKYDEVMTRQREVIYDWRSGILREGKANQLVVEWIDEVVDEIVAGAIDPAEPPARWEWDDLFSQLIQLYPHSLTEDDFDSDGGMTVTDVVERIQEDARSYYEKRDDEVGAGNLREL